MTFFAPVFAQVRVRHVALVMSAVAVLLALSCESETFVLGDLGGEDDRVPETGEGGNGGEEAACRSSGEACSSNSGCCSEFCLNGACAVRVPECAPEGQVCESARECCSLSCVSGTCGAMCSSDGSECASEEECCSGVCASGACQPLSTECRTSGNECAESSECCSGLCTEGRCSLASSFCAQEHDVCSVDGECCSFRCVFEEGARLGTCGAPPNGPSNCSDGLAGSLCGDCNDCCSRLCEPFGNYGVSVCVLATGCRQTGELCARDSDCCGGDPDSGLPGAGNVSCDIQEGEEWGVCRNALSCSPQGNVCHIQNYACGVSSAANRCCGTEGGDGVCLLDSDGVPRCNGLGSSCQPTGEHCAINEDCCSGGCLPADDGVLRCAARPECLTATMACTANSECCPGTFCARSSGDAFGVCSEDSGVDCSLSGQLCGGDQPPCCGEGLCRLGRCETSVEP